MPYQPHGIGTQEELRRTFNGIAQLYDQMRPSYPAAVFDDVLAISGAGPSSRALEIGCGTGHATQEFAARGFTIHCIELGENMAAIARERLAAFTGVQIEVGDFDLWIASARYDLIYSATAYHWLDPATREQRIASALEPRGWLAFWRNRHIRNGSSDDFLDEAAEIYAAEAAELAGERGHLMGPDEIVAAEREPLSRELFDEPVIRVYFWSRRYSAEDYVRLLATHSDHQLLPEEARGRLLRRLKSLIETRYGGSVVKDHATVLQMARKRV